MREIAHDGTNYICGWCKRTARMLPRRLEEIIAGRNEWWVHDSDNTPVCFGEDDLRGR